MERAFMEGVAGNGKWKMEDGKSDEHRALNTGRLALIHW